MRIELLKPHTHVGKTMQPGEHLEVTEEIASWLIREGVAKAANFSKTADSVMATDAPQTDLPPHSKHPKEDKPK